MLNKVTRRKALQLGAAATALPLVHIRTAGAAGKVSIAIWNHWVEDANNVLRKQLATFGDINKVEVQGDFIEPSANSQLLMIEAAEALAKAGHDIYSFPAWEVQNHIDDLEPVDDVMARLTAKVGPANAVCEFLAKANGHWYAVPSSTGGQVKGAETRISYLKQTAGLDVVEMFPAKAGPMPGAESWTYEALLKAAEACDKAGQTFGIGLGTTSDSVEFAGILFAAHGAELVNAKGEITVRSEPVRQVLDYCQRLVRVLPKSAVAYDDTSNNRAYGSGQSALIFNPPSPWALAKRDAPQIAADTWHIPAPSGPKGRFTTYQPYFLGVWNFAKNKTAAKELIEFLGQRENVEARTYASGGYDIPPFVSMSDFKVWEDAVPPKGTLFNYPIRPEHKSVAHVAGLPAPPRIAVQIYNQGVMPTMMAKLLSGQSINDVLNWAQDRLEGFMRG
jgi:ABC-type glycerol-3-phosphate transport system substrate-binding protein